jgi:transcriptional regulator with XRE-family HTH domain
MQPSLRPAENNPAVQLGLNIRVARVRAGYSRETLSALSGLSMNYIGIVERGLKNITILNCQKLAEALGTNICNLLEGVFDSGANSTP